MVKWLEETLKEVDGITPEECVGPEDEVEEGEVVVGEVGPESRKLYTFVGRLRQQGNQLVPSGPVSLAKLMRSTIKITQLGLEAEALQKLFWVSLHLELGNDVLWGEGIGVRKGWKVVTLKDQEEKTGGAAAQSDGETMQYILANMRGIFGGGEHPEPHGDA